MKIQVPYFLIKIGQQKYIEALRNQGHLYLNTVNYFKGIEEAQRGDANEGVGRIEQVNWLKIQIGDKIIEMKKDQPLNRLVNAQLRITNPELQGNIYSMISISSDTTANEAINDERNSILGDTFLIITNVSEFIKRINNQLKILGLKPQYGYVSYYDPNIHNGDLNIFQKEIRFKHQSEFRLFIEHQINSVLQFKIGTIEDISRIFPISEFKNIKLMSGKKI